MTHTTQTSVSMYNLNLLPYDNVSKDRKERKHRGHSAFAINNKERNMIDLEAIREVAYSGPTLICVSDDNDFMATVYELGRELIDVTLNSPRLGKEEVTDHGDVVRHVGILLR